MKIVSGKHKSTVPHASETFLFYSYVIYAKKGKQVTVNAVLTQCHGFKRSALFICLHELHGQIHIPQKYPSAEFPVPEI